MQHLYIHIPFCKSRCPYCDFYTIINNSQQQIIYTDALLNELNFFTSYLTKPLQTIYFGGGTPSILEETQLTRIFDFLRTTEWSSQIEITFEANPLTITADKCKFYHDLGINRVSLGTQSFVDSELKTLGRQHRNRDSYAAYKMLRDAGFANINLDLLIGIPGQTAISLQDSLTQIAALNPEHISPYILTYYEDTVYTKMINSGRIKAANNDLEADLFDQATEFLASNGYLRYEISNFAKAGFYSRHNMNTWRFGEYLGVGCAAHSFFDLKRRANPTDFSTYLQQSENSNWLSDQQSLTRNDEISEYIMLALRTVEGLGKNDFQKRFNQDFSILFAREYFKHCQNGLLEDGGSRIYLSKKGMDLFNFIVADFML